MTLRWFTTLAKRTVTATIAAALLLSTPSCGKEKAPIEPPGSASAAKEPSADEPDEPTKRRVREPVPPAAGATPGDVVPPLPTPAPRLFDGQTSAPALPDVSCEELTPEKGFKLARKLEVQTPPAKKGDPIYTMELCLFHKWDKRQETEIAHRTGRRHHVVAAFPGSRAASWTSKEVTRNDLGLPEQGASGLAAGWAAIVATSVPKWPAVAVVSARFYGGELGEEVHYLRRARVLLKSSGRWTWAPLHERAFATLDAHHLKARCADPANAEAAPCTDVDGRILRAAKQAEKRLKLRKARLAGKADGKRRKAKKGKPLSYKDDHDPQAAWIRDGEKALVRGDSKLAIRNALRVYAVCGEASGPATKLIKKAAKRGKIALDQVRPHQKAQDLCDPLPDKSPPKERKK